MYTLEDDQETSANLRKRNYTQAINLPADLANGGTNQNHPPKISREQITNSFKKLTTPAKANTGGKNVALAALTIACIGVFFTALDQTVVVTALPQIITDLQIPIIQLDHAAWIVSAYLLGFIIAMPLMGRVSDIYGRRRIFLLCLTIFGIGSILCGIAPILGQMWDLGFLNTFNIDTSSPGLTWLIGARFFQAIGGGAVVPVAMAIASDFYGEERRGLALGIIGAITEAGGVLGPLYGAVVVQHLGWQWIFFLNVPVVIGLLIAAWILIPKGTRLHERIDWFGAIILGLALTCLSLGLAQQGTSLGPTYASSDTPQNNPIALGLALLLLLGFVLVERKVRWPVVDLSLFKRFPFSATSLVSLFVGAALIIAMADIPIFVDTVLQRSVLDSGLALMRLTVMIPIGALLGGWLCNRISCRLTGVLGLLFTAAGFYLMSRWPVDVDWNQITVSTITAGLGFGLVIAPIGTTAINAVRPTQAGMSSAVVTSLRMLGMTLGLAALTSWALAYFKQLASTYPSLPTTATADQFSQWSRGYATHLINSAHTVYSSVFFATMVLCMIAIVPAFFLWGRKPPVAALATDTLAADANNNGLALASATLASAGFADTITPSAPTVIDPTLDANAAFTPLGTGGLPPEPPEPPSGNRWWHWRNWRNPKDRRRLIIALACLLLVLLLIGGGIIATFTLGQDDSGNSTTNPNQPGSNKPGAGTATPVSGVRMIQLALDDGALTSLFVQELGIQQGVLTDMKVTPTANDGLVMALNLHIDANGIHRVMPVELDSTVGLDQQQNIQLHVLHLKRDGNDAGPAAAASMEKAVNQLLISSVMPALRGELKSVKLVSVHTSSSIGCASGTVMLVLLIQAPPIDGISAQPTPVPFCFKGPIDINKLLPQ